MRGLRLVASLAPLLVVGLACAGASRARAQLAVEGGPSSTTLPSGVVTVRWPDVAHHPERDVFLAVSGAGRVGGVLLDGAGSPTGASFVVDAASAYAQAPRVASAGSAGFVVAWHESVGDATRIRARTVAHDGSARAGDYDVSPAGTNWEMGAALAFSVASDELLVAWQSIADTRIVAQRFAANGTLRGPAITVDPRAYYFRDPSVAHHAATDTFFVATAGCVADRDCFVEVQRIRAGTGELVGAPLVLEEHLEAGYVPELAYVAHAETVLAVWHYRVSGTAGFRARAIDASGSLSPVREVSSLGSYDANGLAYSPVSGTVLWVSHGTDASDVAIELGADGTPLGGPLSFGVVPSTGNFNPRVTASAREPRWVAVTSTEFRTLTAQAFTTASRDPALSRDAGMSDAAPATFDAGAETSDGATVSLDAPSSARVDGGPARGTAAGCGCRTGRAPRDASAPLIAVAALAVLAAQRTRSRSPRARVLVLRGDSRE